MSTDDELRQVEEDLARLRAQNKEVREQIGDIGATDPIEIGAMIAMADEQEQLINELERRRDELRRRLTQS
ncbi:hypothetical protein ACWGH8_00365 [Nonomuraea muscovyensis]|uniref:Seryl-tRNA synthetase n=1 Tax=Nonomuraea muscovyensis TaxID=1124761 RepID=A0A7X0C059_9ACTN|nr:hypothetical protein [Nonomuraea muscovyensis]MBB6345301.1 seryl-tRNA synthetase [Nonomuraea muscovyensis]MDF2705087.1 hypothetical protein [Nonomuraea muscovyensis]